MNIDHFSLSGRLNVAIDLKRRISWTLDKDNENFYAPINKITPVVVGEVKEFYPDSFGAHAVAMFMREGMKNALEFSPFGRAVYDLNLGKDGICHMFYDGGNYFKDQEIKRRWENKERIVSSRIINPGMKRSHEGCGAGSDFIFDQSDIIEVDTQRGALYCVQFKKRFA